MNGTTLKTVDPTRRLVYALLLVVVGGAVAGRIFAAQLVWEPHIRWSEERPPAMPTFSSNDRSRWATIYQLVHHGTYAIGQRTTDRETGEYRDEGIIFREGWKSVDKVLNPEPVRVTDDAEVRNFYSSKPPLLPTLIAGGYWLLNRLFGWELTDEDDVWWVVRTTLLAVNLLPFLLYLYLLSRLLERFGGTDWGRLYVFAAACFATFLTTFAITLNNHSIATYGVLFALYPAVRIVYDGERSPWLFALAGLFASFTACMDLPAASFAALLGAVLLLRAPVPTLAWFAPAAAVPVLAFFLTNYAAIGQWKPAYGEFGGPWYQYEGSHWRVDPDKPKTGIDWAARKESRAVYALHFLVGHHGVFSLSPVWLLALAGMVLPFRRRAGPPETAGGWYPGLALFTLVLTLVVLGFFTLVVGSRNYGGWTSGPRWVMWLTPLWLLVLLPVADRLGTRRGGRALAYAFLALSVLSVSYPAWNPWRHPWIYNFMESRDWIEY